MLLDIRANALCALIMQRAAVCDHTPECGILFGCLARHEFLLKQALGKVAQMDDKTVEIQRIAVELFSIKLFDDLDAAVNELGDVIHFAHVCVQLGIHNMKRNKCGFVFGQFHAELSGSIGRDDIQSDNTT